MGKPLKVVFLVDALGWEVVQRFRFCEDLLEHRAELGTVLGYSSAAIPSLLSGCTPGEHGAWSMYRLAGKKAPFGYLKFLPKLPHPLEWRARRLARRITDGRGDISGYYDLYDIPLKLLARFDLALYDDPYLPGGLGSETIFDALARENIPYKLWYYKTSEADNIKGLTDAMDRGFDLLFLYTAELDALQHGAGVFDRAVEEKLGVYEKFLSEVLEKAGKLGRDLSVYVLSDHGMTDVHSDVDLWGHLEGRGFKIGKDYLAFFDSTMARFWGPDRVKAAAVEFLGETGKGRLLSDDDLKRYGCLFDDRSYGESIFLMEPGVMIVPSFMGRERIAAMHGYDPEDDYSKGCFLTNDGTGRLPASILDFKSYLLQKLTGTKE
jgi:hypothetical protein